VHVLTKVHKSLRVGGVLLDTHPEPEDRLVEIRLADGHTVTIGRIDESSLISNIRAARTGLEQLIAAGMFQPERELAFEFLGEHASVDSWLEFRTQQAATGKLADDIISRARALLSQQHGAIVVRERSRALKFVRLARS
jgi:hypothetical protein